MSSLTRGFSTKDYIESYNRTHFIAEDEKVEEEHEESQEGSILLTAK